MGFGYRRLWVVLCGLALVASLVAVAVGRAQATTAIGACCQSNLECVSTDPFSCEEAGGIFFGDGVSCDSVECGLQVAVPVYSIVGMIGLVGGLAGIGLFRLVRRPRGAVAS